MYAVTLPGSREAAISRRTSVVALLFLASLALTPHDARGQTRLPTAQVLRRVAEAVDGHRSGRDVWVVASQLDSVNIIGVFESPDSADAAVRRTNPSLLPLRMGPFKTVRDGRFELGFLVGCHHDGISAMSPRRFGIAGIDPGFGLPGTDPGTGVRPSSSAARDTVPAVPPGKYCPLPVIPRGDIARVTITILKRDGTTVTENLPLTADAVFFSLSAIDKFAMPYYARVLGAEPAAALRREIVRGIP
jgi:hypothetical protein